MKNISWINAPDWATGHGLIAFNGITEVWFNDDQYAVVGREGGPYPWGGGKGDTRHNNKQTEVCYITRRPEAWNGEGLPPVGLEVECTFDHWGYWLKGKVLCYGQQMIFMEHESSKGDRKFEGSMNHDGIRFRPIRTPEQIAAEEREKAIFQMQNLIEESDKHGGFDQLGVLYDAGYRKQVAP